MYGKFGWGSVLPVGFKFIQKYDWFVLLLLGRSASNKYNCHMMMILEVIVWVDISWWARIWRRKSTVGRPKDNIETSSTCERACDCVVLGKSETSACKLQQELVLGCMRTKMLKQMMCWGNNTTYAGLGTATVTLIHIYYFSSVKL